MHFTDAGLRAQRAASGRPLAQLVLHDLTCVAITDAGAAALAGAEMVQLQGCPGVFLTNEGLYSLAGATYLAFTGGDFAFTGQGLLAAAGLRLGPPAMADPIRIQVQKAPLPLKVLKLASAGEFADELDVLQAFGVEVIFVDNEVGEVGEVGGVWEVDDLAFGAELGGLAELGETDSDVDDSDVDDSDIDDSNIDDSNIDDLVFGVESDDGLDY
ncbi:MAG: hypothetical protein EBU46_14590 [Nitrosomonadaceae bacterium]|nr:hypothetical protein [Nitrosomonadaceae bacterium]